MIISKTPFRIPLVGGGTDIDFYYKNRGGLLISATINKFIYTMLCKRIDKKILIQTTKSEFLDNINEVKYNKGIAYLLKYYRLNKSFQVSIFSNLPTNSGIGSSSSVFVGLAKSIYEQKSKKMSPEKLAKEIYYIERKLLKNDGGWQDQIMASYGGLLKIKINKKGKFFVKKINLKKNIKRKIENNLVLVYSKISRYSSKLIRNQRINPNKKNIINLYDKLKEKVNDFEKYLIQGNIKEIGRTFDDHWKIKKKLSKMISNSTLDKIYMNLMKSNNFYGGKIIGAGGGGFFLMAFRNKTKGIRFLHKNNLSFLKIKFTDSGSEILYKSE